jgi:hypothetical protein
MTKKYHYSATFIISNVLMERLKESDNISDRMKVSINHPDFVEISLDRQYVLVRISGTMDTDLLRVDEEWNTYGELSDVMDEIVRIQKSLRPRPPYTINVKVHNTSKDVSVFSIRRGPYTTAKDFNFPKSVSNNIN